MSRLLPLLFALASATAHAAFSVETLPVTLAEHATAVDLYVPAADAPRGLAVIAHGFTRSRGRHAVLARRLADEGFVVAVPDLPHWVHHGGNADAIVDLVRTVADERGLDALPVVLIGTSAGGLATLLATDRVPRLALWVGLDPVDAFGLAERAARSLVVPAVVLRGPSGVCNVGGSAHRIAGWLPNRRAEVRIEGASHCDFEDTTNWRCESTCGPADPARQALIVDEAVKAVRDAVPRWASGASGMPDRP
jgi:predicted dienelactone hydrolase